MANVESRCSDFCIISSLGGTGHEVGKIAFKSLPFMTCVSMLKMQNLHTDTEYFFLGYCLEPLSESGRERERSGNEKYETKRKTLEGS